MSNSSASTNVKTCGFCHRGTEAESSCGQFYTESDCSAHKKCMQYSALLVQYRTKRFGGFKKHKVIDEMKRGRGLPCHACRGKKWRKGSRKQKPLKGATCGCAISTCRKTFHYYCAHHDDHAICRRIEVRNKLTDRASVLYRVFCSSGHQARFEKENIKEMEISYNSESSATEYSSGDDAEEDDSIKPTKLTKTKVNLVKDKGAGDKGNVDSKASGDNNITVNSELSNRKEKRPRTLTAVEAPRNKRSRNDEHEKTPSEDGDTTRSNTEKSGDSESVDVESAPESEQVGGVVKFKSEPLSPPTTKTSLTDQAKSESDVVLCIMEEGHHLEKYGSRIRQMISKQFNIHESSIHFWSGQGSHQVSQQHMLLYMRDVAKAVYQSNKDTLQRLITRSIQSDLETYSEHIQYMEDYMDDALLSQMQTRIRDVIGDYFLQANKSSGVEAGGAFILAELNSIFIALLLGKHLDPVSVIRNRLSGKEVVYPLAFNVDLGASKSGAVLPEKEQQKTSEREIDMLSSWLQHDVDEPLKIRVRPKEVILRQTTTKSNTCQLCNYFQRRSAANQHAPGSVAMFIVPVRGDIVAYGAYCREAISAFVQEELTALNPVYCVLDVDELEGFACVEDILPPLQCNITVCAISGLNPAVFPVSCVILKLSIGV